MESSYDYCSYYKEKIEFVNENLPRLMGEMLSF